MRRCPSCLRVFADTTERCSLHGALEAFRAARLRARLDAAGRLDPAAVLELLDSLARLDEDALDKVSVGRLFVASTGSSALEGIDVSTEPEELELALYEPTATDATKAQRRRHRSAVLCWELLTGDAPFAARNARAVRVRKRLERLPSLRALRPDLSPALADALTSALARDAGPDFLGNPLAELRSALAPPPFAAPPPAAFGEPAATKARFSAELPLAASAFGAPPPPAEAPPPAARRSSAWLALPLFALLVVGAALTLFTRREAASPSPPQPRIPATVPAPSPSPPPPLLAPAVRSPAGQGLRGTQGIEREDARVAPPPTSALEHRALEDTAPTDGLQGEPAPSPWRTPAAIGALLALVLGALFLLRRASATPVEASTEQPEAEAARLQKTIPRGAFDATILGAESAPARTEVDALAATAASGPGVTRPSARAEAPPFQPFAVGAYDCVARLGEGAMGVVYRAVHRDLGRACALKVLLPDLAERPELMEQFREEARLASSVQHPNTVLVYDFGELDGGMLYLVMELLEGRTLGAVLEEGAPSTPRALSLARQLCDGLGALHAKGILHRDLKPGNVMVLEREGEEPVLKLVDFGLARVLEGADRASLAPPAEGPEKITGTPLYMAPEQARGERSITLRADLFSLAVVLFEVLAGAPPFDLRGRTVLLLLSERAAGTYRTRRLGDVRPALRPSEALEALFREGLAPEAAQRPATAQLFYTRLREALAS